MSLSFLEASKIVTADNKLDAESFVLAASGQTEKLDIFLKAISIQKGFNSHYRTLPFNTLQQYISVPATASETHHIFILFPWDIIPEADWRSGVAQKELREKEIRLAAEGFVEKLKHFSSKSILYVPAPMLPMTCNLGLFYLLELYVKELLLKERAKILSEDFFSLSSYLSNGCAFTGKYLPEISNAIVECLPKLHSAPKKLLVTDFDNVMWRGVVSEDGAEGIQCSNEGAGYIHFIYQSYLLKLKSEGVLIAGVTRNDAATAILPFRLDKTGFKEQDFVALLASYNSKSAQIKELSRNLNITLDNIVFVDDNPLELEEVTQQLPQVECLMFPEKNEGIPELFSHLQNLFNISQITDEDKQRTELYKTRFKTTEVSHAPGADLSDYLRSLEMALSVTKCESSNYKRSLQLFNKTNQFNLNGARMSDDQITVDIENGSKLYSFSLRDKFGHHGQVCSVMISAEGIISHFVMSCRVFQRKIEYAALLLISGYLCTDKIFFAYKRTERNIPFQDFIGNDAFTVSGELLMLDTKLFIRENKDVLDLFNMEVFDDK